MPILKYALAFVCLICTVWLVLIYAGPILLLAFIDREYESNLKVERLEVSPFFEVNAKRVIYKDNSNEFEFRAVTVSYSFTERSVLVKADQFMHSNGLVAKSVNLKLEPETFVDWSNLEITGTSSEINVQSNLRSKNLHFKLTANATDVGPQLKLSLEKFNFEYGSDQSVYAEDFTFSVRQLKKIKPLGIDLELNKLSISRLEKSKIDIANFSLDGTLSNLPFSSGDLFSANFLVKSIANLGNTVDLIMSNQPKLNSEKVKFEQLEIFSGGSILAQLSNFDSDLVMDEKNLFNLSSGFNLKKLLIADDENFYGEVKNAVVSAKLILSDSRSSMSQFELYKNNKLFLSGQLNFKHTFQHPFCRFNLCASKIPSAELFLTFFDGNLNQSASAKLRRCEPDKSCVELQSENTTELFLLLQSMKMFNPIFLAMSWRELLSAEVFGDGHKITFKFNI